MPAGKAVAPRLGRPDAARPPRGPGQLTGWPAAAVASGAAPIAGQDTGVVSGGEPSQHPAPGQGQGAGHRVAPDPGATASRPDRTRCLSDARVIQRVSCPRGRDAGTARGPACGRPAVPQPARLPGSPETTLRLADDHDRIADELNDLVAGRLRSAGLDLEAARGLIGEHRAAGRIQHAISELGPGDQGYQGYGVRFLPGGLACRRDAGLGAWWCCQVPRRAVVPGLLAPPAAARAGTRAPAARWRNDRVAAAAARGRCGRSWPVPPRIRSTDDRPGR